MREPLKLRGFHSKAYKYYGWIREERDAESEKRGLIQAGNEVRLVRSRARHQGFFIYVRPQEWNEE